MSKESSKKRAEQDGRRTAECAICGQKALWRYWVAGTLTPLCAIHQRELAPQPLDSIAQWLEHRKRHPK